MAKIQTGAFHHLFLVHQVSNDQEQNKNLNEIPWTLLVILVKQYNRKFCFRVGTYCIIQASMS